MVGLIYVNFIMTTRVFSAERTTLIALTSCALRPVTSAAHSTAVAQASVNRTVFGGSGEIRTHERVAPLPVFKTGALNRSATLPKGGFCRVFVGPYRGIRSLPGLVRHVSVFAGRRPMRRSVDHTSPQRLHLTTLHLGFDPLAL